MKNYEINNNAINININVNAHSSVQIDDIFFDPYLIEDVTKKAKYIFLSHTHYDHLSEKDIDIIISDETTIIATPDAEDKLAKYNNKKIFVIPDEKYQLDNFEFQTFPAYNINKNFHKKENKWVGYKIIKDGVSYVILGDTDSREELENLKCDILFVPIGGTYTMNPSEAADLTNKIKPQIVIPTHYGSIVGKKIDAVEFASSLSDDIICKTFF